MKLLRALYAFYKTLFWENCTHSRVSTNASHTVHCQDCGYPVRVLWTLIRCRTCGGKRLPSQAPDGAITPQYRYCQHCGSPDYQLMKRSKIHSHELSYAVALKEIDYQYEQSPITAHRVYGPNPFTESHQGNPGVFTGKVLRKREFAIN